MALAAALAVAAPPGLRAAELASPRQPMLRIAQSDQPPGDVPGAGNDQAALVVRVEQLEGQLRNANGAIEQLQNQQRLLQEQLKRFQEDVDFRLGHGAAPGPVAEAAPRAGAAEAVPRMTAEGLPRTVAEAAPGRPARRSDAFDPAADPSAVGAPHQLGTTSPSVPLADARPTVGAPMDLSRAAAGQPATAAPAEAAPAGPAVIAGIGGPQNDPREQFNAALESYRIGQYDQAEQQLRAFLARNGNNKLAPDATFYLGETFLQRSRPREAAEQYLKVSTDYAKSARAPEGMLRLGESLAALGNNDQACATFGEVGRRYPNASAALKRIVEREIQKDHC